MSQDEVVGGRDGCLQSGQRADLSVFFCVIDPCSKEGRQKEITVSMSGKGNCYDNTVGETFFKTLKSDLNWIINDFPLSFLPCSYGTVQLGLGVTCFAETPFHNFQNGL